MERDGWVMYCKNTPHFENETPKPPHRMQIYTTFAKNRRNLYKYTVKMHHMDSMPV
jgi:hypothetical protein